jgi:hypothetical protein
MATGNKKSNLIINIESKAAQDSIKKLQAEVEKLTASLKKSGITNSQYVETQNKLIDVEKQLNKEIKENTTVVSKNSVVHKNSLVAIQQKINALRQEMGVMDMSSEKFKTASANMRQLTASMREGSSATGLHAASAMELGRVFSDMPYGIRGVANNISQLGSLMAQAATTTNAATGKAIGMSGALKGLWKSLMGPLGVLLAFQAAIAALESFNNSAKDTDSTLSKLGQEGVTTMTTKLNLFFNKTNDSTIALETKRETVRRANEEIKDLNAEIDENGNLTLASAKNIHAMSTELMKMAKAAAAVEMIKELNREIIKISLSQGETYFSFAKILGLEDNDAIIKKQKDDAIAKIKKDIDDIINIGKDQDFLPQIFGEDDKKGGGKRSKALKIFKGKILDLTRFILAQDKERLLIQEKNIRERLKLEQKYAKDELDIKLKTFIETQKQRRDDFLKKAKTDKEKAQANKTFNDMVMQAEGEHSMAMRALVAKNTVETKELERTIKEEYDINSQKAALDRASAELDLMNDLLDEKDPRALAVLQQKQMDVWALEDAAFEEDIARKLIKLQEEGNSLAEAEFLVEEERMARMADRNNAEVEMERAKIESIKAVRMEYIGWLSSIGSTMKKLSKDNEGLAKAAVIVEKSAATAKVIASTQAANAEIMQESGAASAKTIVQGKAAIAAGGILAANPVTAALGAAQIAAGTSSIAAAAPIAAAAKGRILKNNIGAGLAIANIWAESQGSSGDAGGSGGSGGGGNSFNPHFNVVGNSETNQLAESIGGQVNQPNRAYVVYEDIENAGQLEANAVESVTI